MHYSDFLLVSMVESYGGSNFGIVGLSPILRSEILLIELRFFKIGVLIDPVRGRSWKSVSSRTRYPHFLLSDQRSAIIRPRKSRNPEKPILDFARCMWFEEHSLPSYFTPPRKHQEIILFFFYMH